MAAPPFESDELIYSILMLHYCMKRINIRNLNKEFFVSNIITNYRYSLK